jgi:hypothetical protein
MEGCSSSDSSRQALREEDGELRICSSPLDGRFPVHAEIPQRQAEQLHRRLVRGEGASGLDDLTQASMQALDGIVNRYEKCGANIPLQLRLAAAYSATIRDRGPGSTKVGAGRSVR